ncbi:MAG: hypothetical protein ACREOI_19420, partial [bacterium]
MVSIIGQESAKEFLRRAQENARVAHAYLFHGPEGTGKEALAVLAAQSFLCEARRPQTVQQPATISLFDEPAAPAPTHAPVD